MTRMKRIIPFALVLGLTLGLGTAQSDAWLRDAQLGPYAPAEEDWDAVYEAAQNEPTLYVYMTTSRVQQPIARFQELYPGVNVEGVHVNASDMLERLRRELDAGAVDVGLLHAPNPEDYLTVFGERLVSYVPPEYRDAIPEFHQDPLTYRFLPTGWTYNDAVFPDGVPGFDSLWDLTTDEYRGRIVIPDPLRTESGLNYLASVVGMPDVLEAEYERRFGQPIELREQDAGFEWFRRLLENDPHVVPGTRDVAEAVTNATDVLIGLNNFSRMREAYDDPPRYRFAFASLQPFDMVNIPMFMAMVGDSGAPNAAKLYIRYLLGEGGESWFEEGNPPAMVDWQPPPGWMTPIATMTTVDVDYDFLMNRKHEVEDFWILNR